MYEIVRLTVVGQRGCLASATLSAPAALSAIRYDRQEAKNGLRSPDRWLRRDRLHASVPRAQDRLAQRKPDRLQRRESRGQARHDRRQRHELWNGLRCRGARVDVHAPVGAARAGRARALPDVGRDGFSGPRRGDRANRHHHAHVGIRPVAEHECNASALGGPRRRCQLRGSGGCAHRGIRTLRADSMGRSVAVHDQCGGDGAHTPGPGHTRQRRGPDGSRRRWAAPRLGVRRNRRPRPATAVRADGSRTCSTGSGA